MTQARRMHTRVTDAERAEIRREIMAEVRGVFDSSDSFDEVRDKFDEGDPEPLSYSDIENMSEEQINVDWERVSKVLSAGREFRPDGDELPPAARKPTGQQFRSESDTGPGPLTLDAIKGMSSGEINRRWSEVQQVLQGGRR